MRLTAAVAEKRIHELAAVTENLIWGSHTRLRMKKRDISDTEVLRILRTGFVDRQPTLTQYSEWKCKITLKIRGGRTAGVVTVLLHSGKLFLKTVEWEDL